MSLLASSISPTPIIGRPPRSRWTSNSRVPATTRPITPPRNADAATAGPPTAYSSRRPEMNVTDAAGTTAAPSRIAVGTRFGFWVATSVRSTARNRPTPTARTATQACRRQPTGLGAAGVGGRGADMTRFLSGHPTRGSSVGASSVRRSRRAATGHNDQSAAATPQRPRLGPAPDQDRIALASCGAASRSRTDRCGGPVFWPAATLDAMDAAIHAARSGERALLGVEGDAGFGKSTLLQAAVAKLNGFQVLRAFGEQDARDERYQLLHEWDALPAGAPIPQHTLQAVRLLAQVVDRLEQTGPVALVLDDLQWIDPESVDALTALVRRAAGVRLLVLAAYRPLGSRHPAWRQLIGPVLRLAGLDGPAAAALVAALDPAAPAALAEQLRVHTGGSPLHMRALLQEHPTRELVVLAARGELPAPADLAATVHSRVAALAPDAAQLLRALAVLGDAWADLPTAAAVGGVRDADAALAALR